jgi:hypothetical protein
MSADIIRDRLSRAIQPILADAAEAGLLVGGTLKVLRHSGDGWEPVHVLTIRREAPAPEPDGHGDGNGKHAGYTPTGDVCPKCGSVRMQRAGTCSVCLDCGESGGCG